MDELIEEIEEHTEALKVLAQELYEVEVNNMMMIRSEMIEDYIWTIEEELRNTKEEWAEQYGEN